MSTEHFEKSTFVPLIASSFLPGRSSAWSSPSSFWFLHSQTGESFGVDNPIRWSLQNAQQPILERAKERLTTLDESDPERIVRLVTRRCRLNLLEVAPHRVIVHHWGTMGLADVRPFFKQHRLARKDVEVVVIAWRTKVVRVQPGDEFLYGEPLAEGFPVVIYFAKWRHRNIEEPDDRQPAPDSRSSFIWEGVERGRIHWAALKSAWRREPQWPCRNCDQPTILVGFGLTPFGMFSPGRPRFLRICSICRQFYEEHEPRDVVEWANVSLDKQTLPSSHCVFGWGRHEERWQVRLPGRAGEQETQ